MKYKTKIIKRGFLDSIILSFIRKIEKNNKRIRINLLRKQRWIEWQLILEQMQWSNEYIFGGYSPCKCQQNSGDNWVYDDTQSSFLFSQTHNEIYSLKKDQKNKAICCNSGYGPTYGYFDLYISFGFKEGYSQLGNSYQWDKFENKNSTHLFGQNDPKIIECEIFELKFI
ncbi:unnamed protein product [Paramecium sonneborni]|uniref:TLDc domain-containing protein n=1 Tax=Paramecium sonneborni TaxID=65129 RepID=A0A8S1RQH5_9CILI|nr:unnamed protein product [Paramecium sonneborni]